MRDSGDPCDEGAEGRGIFPAFDLWDWDCDNWVRVQADKVFDFVVEFGDCFPVFDLASVGSVDKDLGVLFGCPEGSLGGIKVFEDGVQVPPVNIEVLWGRDGGVG